MSHFITGRKYVHFACWSKKCPSKICPSKIRPSKKRPGAVCKPWPCMWEHMNTLELCQSLSYSGRRKHLYS